VRRLRILVVAASALSLGLACRPPTHALAATADTGGLTTSTAATASPTASATTPVTGTATPMSGVALLPAATPTATASPTPTEAAGASAPPTATTVSATGTVTATASGIIATAQQYLGYPYAYIGDDPSTGFSCIGFAHYVFAQNGVYVPEELGKAYDSAPHVNQQDLQPGDLVFFQNTVWNGISHVGLYIGAGKMIAADTFQTGVQVDTLSDDYWQQHYLGATRPLSDPSGTPLYTGNGSADPVTTPITSGPSLAPPTAGPTLRLTTGAVILPRHSATVYSGPDGSYHSIDTVTSDITLTVVQTQGQWVNVAYADGNQYGWIHGPDLNLPSGGQSAPSTSTRQTSRQRHWSWGTQGGGHGGSTGGATDRARVQVVKGFHGTSTKARDLIVKATILFVRTAPNAHARVLHRLWAGDHVYLLATNRGWDYVALRSNARGWVSAAWVS